MTRSQRINRLLTTINKLCSLVEQEIAELEKEQVRNCPGFVPIKTERIDLKGKGTAVECFEYNVVMPFSDPGCPAYVPHNKFRGTD